MHSYYQAQNQALNSQSCAMKNAQESEQTLDRPVSTGSETKNSNTPPKTPYDNAAVITAVSSIPITLISSTPELANASAASLILFGALWVSTLIFEVWAIKQLIANGIVR